MSSVKDRKSFLKSLSKWTLKMNKLSLHFWIKRKESMRKSNGSALYSCHSQPLFMASLLDSIKRTLSITTINLKRSMTKVSECLTVTP